jgi:hypothetical protein
VLVGSRCGPFAPALAAMRHPAMRALLARLLQAEFALERGVEALCAAAAPGALKIHIVCQPTADGRELRKPD